MIPSATVTIVASAALSNKTPTSTTTVSSTAKVKIVVAIDTRNIGDQIPVFTPRIVQIPRTRKITLQETTRTFPAYRPSRICARDTGFDTSSSIRPGSSTLGTRPDDANTAKNSPQV